MQAEPYTDEQLARILTDPNVVHDQLRVWPTFRRLLREATEVVICAAVRDIDGKVLRCQRHGDGLGMVVQRRSGYPHDPDDDRRCDGVTQGFITSRNRFVDRREALRMQLAAGIESKAPGGYRGDQLYSEDLY